MKVSALFQKDLNELIRGLRLNKDKEYERAYIEKSFEEIRNELKSTDTSTKATAVLKIAYLRMIEFYNLDWALFDIIQVMSHCNLQIKKQGYIASERSFYGNQNILILAVNLLRKDLAGNANEVSLALNAVCSWADRNIITEIVSQVCSLLNHTKFTIRKKAIAALYYLIKEDEQLIEQILPTLKEKVKEKNGIINLINTICELVDVKPSHFMTMVPVLFSFLIDNQTPSWALIKIMKILTKLSKLETRLIKKLEEPLTNLICNHASVSLVVECIATVFKIGIADPKIIKVSIRKLEQFISDHDTNLIYVGLLNFKLLFVHDKGLVSSEMKVFHRLIELTNHEDETIKLMAIDLIYYVSNPSNSKTIIEHFMQKLDGQSPSTTNQIGRQILSLLDFIHDDKFKIFTLCKLAEIKDMLLGSEIKEKISSVMSMIDYSNIEYYINLFISVIRNSPLIISGNEKNFIILEYMMSFLSFNHENLADPVDFIFSCLAIKKTEGVLYALKVYSKISMKIDSETQSLILISLEKNFSRACDWVTQFFIYSIKKQLSLENMFDMPSYLNSEYNANINSNLINLDILQQTSKSNEVEELTSKFTATEPEENLSHFNRPKKKKVVVNLNI
ncbi:ARM repeat-containing protein [Rozella allomycis CSF55]|uniref:ARM repeat-containing protein n=1 Tax=Rozella allomycis (strain CSF55) TaxID=988480 RepID=A0A075AUP0_ROZAC|nr:Clathrin/coatomer adaptor, adaptin-like domain-containing protein [Rozella allomycis CSF55]RKP19825.1 ARM repeat-containing protein [Rozella allomycis CSF55]|eukprot:EPZ33880.1 Clathrin/coatomer adaptor, adaptin-like domain-containing protein [Rozella allomycis CSF55]